MQEKKLLLSISSRSTMRLYMVLMKEYLHQEFPDLEVNYLISRHDDVNANKVQAAVLESAAVNDGADIILGLDGYLSDEMYSGVTARRVLLHTLDDGCPGSPEKYINGYDRLIVEDDWLAGYLEKACLRKKTELLSGVRSPIRDVLCMENRIAASRQRLETRFPQIRQKKIIALTTRGKCDERYRDELKSLNLEELYHKLPEGMVFMSNCAQIEAAAGGLPASLADKIICFKYCNLLDVLYACAGNISNISIAEYAAAPNRPLAYSGIEYEKYVLQRHPDRMLIPNRNLSEAILELAGQVSGSNPVGGNVQGGTLSFAELMKTYIEDM